MLNKLFSTKQKKRQTFISQIEVPDMEVLQIFILFENDNNNVIQKMTYGNLFAYAVPRNMIPIGLYLSSFLFFFTFVTDVILFD